MKVKGQNVTSANTSINKNKLPSVYKRIKLESGDRLLDYGCGRYIEHIQNHCNAHGAIYYPYDPYNMPTESNELTLNTLSHTSATIGVMSNVINVIDSDEAIKDAINNAISLISGKLYITVYEGNKSGVGKYTKNNCYQRNTKLKDYVPMLNSMGFKVIIKNRMIIIDGKYNLK